MIQENSLINTIRKRVSIRTYDKRTLTKEDRNALLKEIESLKNPFGVKVHVSMIDKELNPSGEKLGTYGIIKGAKTFLGVSVANEKFAGIAVGYDFESLILYATSIGLGTVWLAATFNRENFINAMNIPEEEKLIAISPVGYPAEKRSITENIMRTTMKSSMRKEWNQLFYDKSFKNPLSLENTKEYQDALEMLRLAPSAKNEQPWRVLKTQDAFHFYTTYKSELSDGEKFIKEVDLGIAILHFHKIVLNNNLKGHFEVLPQTDIEVPENTHYIISWHID